MSAAGFLAVVQVHGQQLVEADRFVELGEHAIKIVHDVVASCPYRARIQANAHLVLQVHLFDHLRKLFELRADLRA